MSKGVSLDDAKRAKPKALEVFASLVGDVAVGIERLDSAGFGLKVNLTAPPAVGVTLPTEIDGVPVKVDIVGTIRKR